MNLGKDRGWKTAYCSFEKPVELHMAQLAEKLIGKPFFDGATPRMSPSDRDYAVDWLSKHFMFMDYRKGGPSDIDGILEAASAAVMRMGCRILVIDPYNYIEVDRSLRETDEAHIWKVKWSWLGRVGHAPLHFDPITTRWRDLETADDDFCWDIPDDCWDS